MAPTLRKIAVWLVCALVFTVPREGLVQAEGVDRTSRVLGLGSTPLALMTLAFQGRWRRLRDMHLLAGTFGPWLALSVSWNLEPSGAGTYDVGRFSPPNATTQRPGFARVLRVPVVWHPASTAGRRATATAASAYLPRGAHNGFPA